MARVLIPLPDHDFDPTETSVPWKTLTSAGHEIVFATETGTAAACDPLLITGVLFGQLGAKDEPKRFYAEMSESKSFRAPIRWDAIDAAAFDMLILPGGHAPGMKQYLAGETLHAKVAAFARTGKPMGAICHGVLVLARAGALKGRKTTCLPKYMERVAYLLTAWKLGKYYRTYPAYVEDEVKAALDDPSHFVRGPMHLVSQGTANDDRAAFVLEDGAYVSARWPGDAHLFARKLLERL